MGLNKFWTKEEIEILEKNYPGMIISQVAIQLDRTPRAVGAKAARLGIKSNFRKLQVGKLSPGRKYNINDDFFDTWSDSMAYILGLLVTDGNIYYSEKAGWRFSITLKSSDKYLLENILIVIGSNHKIYDGKDNSSKIDIANKMICKSLLRLGVTRNKSLNGKCPNIPIEFIPKFLLGVIDGDGSVDKKGGIHIVTASKVFCDGLSNMLKIINIHHTKGEWNRSYENRHTQFLIHILKKKVVNCLVTLMYNNQSLFLQRKYEKISIQSRLFIEPKVL